MPKFFILLLLLAGCSSPKVINVSFVPTPLNVPAIINISEGFFERAMEIENKTAAYHTMYNGSQQIAGLASGEIDIVPTMGDTSLIIGLANGAPITILGVFGKSPKAFVLASMSNSYTNITALKGKKIGGPRGTVLYQLLLKLLEEAGMTINDVEFISMGVSESLPAMLKGEIDAGLLVGPAAAAAKRDGAVIVADGEGYVSGMTLMAAATDFVNNNNIVINNFIQSHADSVSFMYDKPSETLDIVSQEINLPKPLIQSMLPDYTFPMPVTADNSEGFEYGMLPGRDTPIPLTMDDIKSLQDTQDFLYSEGLIPKKIDIIQAIY